MSLAQRIITSLPPNIANHKSTIEFYTALETSGDQRDLSHSANLALAHLPNYTHCHPFDIKGISTDISQEKFMLSVYSTHKLALKPRPTLEKQVSFMQAFIEQNPLPRQTKQCTYLNPPVEIQGYKKEKTKLYNLVHRLGFYQKQTRTNKEMPLDKIPVIIFHGEPGMGKSLFLDAAQYKSQEIAQIKQYECNNISITNCDKSSYQSESARNLQNIMNHAQNSLGLGVICVDEADVVFPANPKTEADIQFTSEFMKKISGHNQTIRGNTAIILATNYLQNIDERIRNRAGPFYTINLHCEHNITSIANILESKVSLYDHELTRNDFESIANNSIQNNLSIREITTILDCANELNKDYSNLSPDFFKDNPLRAKISKLNISHINKILEELNV